MKASATIRRHMIGYGFVFPWLVALACFIGYPFVAGFAYSFCDFPPLKGPAFIGLENYQELAGDELFHRSLGVTFTYAAVAIPLGVILALTLAMFLNARIRGQTFYRVVFYIPHLVPTVVVAILWMWIFNPQFGLINIVLNALGRVANGWTRLFFDIDGAIAGTGVLTGRSLAFVGLAAVGALGVAAMRGMKRKVSTARQMLAVVGMAALGLAAVAAANAGLHAAWPTQMAAIQAPGWLADGNPWPASVPGAPSWALWGLIIMGMWGVGQMAVIYLAKLQDVPVELYEAADIDGANWLSKTWHITIPMISPVILFNVVMAIIGTFQVFAEPYIMTNGGPEDKTRFVAMFVYDQAFLYQRVGYASAVAWVLFVIIVVLTILAFRMSRRHVYYAGR